MSHFILVDERIYPPHQLNSKGRCCGRKPIVYKRMGGPHRFCDRCNRAYSLSENQQIANWSWIEKDGGFQKTEKRLLTLRDDCLVCQESADVERR